MAVRTDETEIRSLVMPVERRATGDTVTVVGYAAVFNSTTDFGYFREVIAPGAFTETLKTADVRAYFDHDRGRVLGRKSAGTLRLHEDSRGLAVEIDLPDTTDGRDVRTLIERGDVSGMSFGFIVRKQQWDETVAPPLRMIQQVDLLEVSIVSEPAYADTSIALRSLDHVRTKRQEMPSSLAARYVARRALFEQKVRGL